MRERSKHYGHGHWERAQLYAIVASYRERGESPEWIARKLGIGPNLTAQIVAYLEERAQ